MLFGKITLQSLGGSKTGPIMGDGRNQAYMYILDIINKDLTVLVFAQNNAISVGVSVHRLPNAVVS